MISLRSIDKPGAIDACPFGLRFNMYSKSTRLSCEKSLFTNILYIPGFKLPVLNSENTLLCVRELDPGSNRTGAAICPGFVRCICMFEFFTN